MTAEIPLTLQTTYAELLDRSVSAAFDDAFAEPGNFTSKTVGGRRYWYFQFQSDSGRRQRYVGPETPELLDRIAKHKRPRDDLRERRALVSTLIRSAYLPRPQPRIGNVIAALAKAGIFRLRAVLVGTVAYQTYGGLLGTRLPAASVQTGDIDVAQFVNISAAVDDRTPAMIEVLKQVDSSFEAVPNLHDHRRTTSYQARGGLLVEFLTPNTGPDTDSPKKLKALGTDAQPLRFLDFLIHDPVPAVVLHDAGIQVVVPAPERYAVHKLIVSQRRHGAGAKAHKDIEQAQALIDVLLRERPAELRAAWKDAHAHGRKWQRHLGEGLGSFDPDIRDRFLKLAGASRSSVPGVSLEFPASAHRYDLERRIVTFLGRAGDMTVRCAISFEALSDHYGATGLDKNGRLAKFREHREEIESLARAKYGDWPVDDVGAVTIKSADVPDLIRHIRRSKVAKRRNTVRFP